MDHSRGIHEPLARAGSLTVVLFDIFDLGILTDVECVDSVMLAVMTAAVADTAACDYDDIAVLTYEEIVIDALFVAGFADDDRDMA